MAGPVPPGAPVRFAAGQQVQVRVLAVGGDSAVPPVPGAAGPPPVDATLVATTRAGQPVLSTPQGTLVLQARSDLPAGTALTVQLQAPAPLPAILPPLDLAQGTEWPALKEVMGMLAASDPTLARTVSAQLLPQATKKLTTKLLFLLSALRGGDAAGWLGEAGRQALEQGGGRGALARLVEDFQAAGRQGAEPAVEGWRSYPVPFAGPDRIDHLRLHVRAIGPDGKDERGEARPRTRRFLVELDLTALGPMQLDGLVQPKRLDLMVRTRTLLPTPLKADLHAIFQDSLQAVGFAGILGFQTGAHGWVTLAGRGRAGG